MSRLGKTQAVRQEEEERPQSLHEKLWVLVVCDNMKIVDVPEEGRRCFIFRAAEESNQRGVWGKKNIHKETLRSS